MQDNIVSHNIVEWSESLAATELQQSSLDCSTLVVGASWLYKVR